MSISATGSNLRGQSGQAEEVRGRLCRKTLNPSSSSSLEPSIFLVGELHARKISPSRDEARKSVIEAGIVLSGATGGPLMPQPKNTGGRIRRIDKMARIIRFKGRL